MAAIDLKSAFYASGVARLTAISKPLSVQSVCSTPLHVGNILVLPCCSVCIGAVRTISTYSR